MSLSLVKSIITELPNGKLWKMHLLCFAHTKRKGTTYNCRRIELSSADRMHKLIQDIADTLLAEGKGSLSKYHDVREYDGTCNGTTINRISEANNELVIDLDALFSGIAESNCEADPFSIKAQAYMLCGHITIDNEDHQIKLVSMYSPITTLKNRFLLSNGKFDEIKTKVLNLRTIVNVIIFDRTVYFLDMSGESLFNIERAYKKKCNEVVSEIERMSIISNPEVFRNVATSGHNPRSLIACSQAKIELLSNRIGRERAAKYFNIPLTKNDLFDTNDIENANKLVKVLCNKAMWDVIEEVPVEVDGSKNWS